MDTIKYEVLLDAIETGSISLTAKRMGYTQSGVSHMLNSLEDELGIKLIIRDRNGVKATTAGKTLIPYVKRIVSEHNSFLQAVSEVSDLLKGSITIGSMDTISTVFLPEIIREFKEIYPDIEFYLKNGSYEDNEHWLLHKDVDCGFILLPSSVPFETFPVVFDRFVVVCGKGYQHHFSEKKGITKKDLLEERLILVDGIDAYEITRIFSADIDHLNVSVTTQNTLAAIQMLQNNLGVCILPCSLAQKFPDTLNSYEFDPPYPRTLALAYQNKKEISPVTKKFIEFVESKGTMQF